MKLEQKIHEYLYLVKKNLCMSRNLPDIPTDLPVVHLYGEQLLKFRIDYQILVETLATFFNKKPEELCMLDILNFWAEKERRRENE